MPIINSVLDTDIYNLSMKKAIARNYPDTPARYEFIDRGGDLAGLGDTIVGDVRREVGAMADLRLTDAEAEWLLVRCPYLGREFVDALRSYRYDPRRVKLSHDKGRLVMSVVGTWDEIKPWDVPLLAILSELHGRVADTRECAADLAGWAPGGFEESNLNRLHHKAISLRGNDVRWAEFGTRRRRSWDDQAAAVQVMREYDGFVGTSNPSLAMRYDVPVVGTMAHEWIMGVGALEGLRHANRHALARWIETFDGALGIALTDTYGTDAFWADFKGQLAHTYKGLRQDSGSPAVFASRAMREYAKRGILPKTREIVFSDGLDVEKAISLTAQFRPYFLDVTCGIGTNLTNDVPGRAAPKFVMKLAECGGVPVCKLSDDPGKASGDRDAIRVAEWTFRNKPLDS